MARSESWHSGWHGVAAGTQGFPTRLRPPGGLCSLQPPVQVRRSHSQYISPRRRLASMARCICGSAPVPVQHRPILPPISRITSPSAEHHLRRRRHALPRRAPRRGPAHRPPALTGLALAHGDDTAFWWTAGIFAVGAVTGGSLLRSGPLLRPASTPPPARAEVRLHKPRPTPGFPVDMARSQACLARRRHHRPLRRVITKDFIFTKDLCTYSIIILRQEKIIRDHRADGGLVRARSGRRVFCGRCDPNKKLGDPACPTRQSDRLGCRRPQQDSNLRTRLRRPMLYPLSYGGSLTQKCYQPGAALVTHARDAPVTGAGHAPQPWQVVA
jgi:hypothetical protein